MILKFLPIFLIVLNASCTQKGEKVDSHLGSVNFDVVGTAEAQALFKEGLLFLHSFEYEDARESFLKAQETDPSMAMSYWGEAMTYNHSLWQRQEKEKAIQALNKFAISPEKRQELIDVPLEQDFFKSIELLFGEGTKYERDIAYNTYLEDLVKKYPNNHEVAAFYAVSLLGASRNGRDENLYDKSARIVQGIIAENPNHPGALHYLIHSYDDPDHAHMAVEAADSYANVAPDAAHALHMPSHIYVALGRWNDVINCNIASWNASINRLKRKKSDDKTGSYHALNWLQYGLLQRGEYKQAEQLLKSMVSYDKIDSTKSSRSYLIAMKGSHMVETNSFKGDLSDIPVSADDLNITKQACNAYLEGMKAFQNKDKGHMLSIVKLMAKKRIAASLSLGDKSFAMCSAGGFANKPPNQLDIDMIHIMEMQLEAKIAELEGDIDGAKSLLAKASILDEALNYSYGPPTIIKPVHEDFGELLIANKDYKMAFDVFQKSLERHPRRLISLRGLKKAAEALEASDVKKVVEHELAISLSPKERLPIL